ncbi:MAG: hypothetical protein CMJ35_03280 [Phycisphaerae bacterium]|nr:hypothetical protein [Phycisphaerae bacterium]MBM90622.1 hypothetical protein [Phycisphaerae bacterium]HCT46756.1 hypothetical protein [Phycisphaerales bacterium]|tara:strand:- start:613 stop:1239 length:627 start_codon:yes stop_codon:yes gene_type:complete
MFYRSSVGTLAVASISLSSGLASADYAFSFSGTILAGTDQSGASLVGQQYTLEMFVLDIASDMTPTGDTGSYALDRVTMNIGSDGTIEDSTSSTSAYSSVFIDMGPTQLVGGSDIFGTAVSFMLGVNLPSDAFSDVHDIGSQGDFSLTGLTSSSYSYYNSGAFGSGLELNNTDFSFSNVAVVPMPTSLAMGLVGMMGAAVATRRHKAR